MTAYRLNGLALPRASAEQFAGGEPIPVRGLQEADLVFFATEDATKPTHVGLYAGEGRFIHATSRGDVVRVDALANSHYERRFLGGRSYLSEP
jgi:cell wall-associated NlpC family hydrolase